MKIKRFSQINEKMSKDVEDYLDNFGSSIDTPNIIDWVKKYSPLEEYKNIEKISKDKNLKDVKKYTDLSNLIENKQKELEKQFDLLLKIRPSAENEILYSLQEDLLKNNFNEFYKNFLQYYVEEIEDDYVDDNLSEEDSMLVDVHPDIVKKYRDLILERIPLVKNANKYNL